MTRPTSGALPLGDLLAVLRGRGLPIGVREHLAARRLLEGWQGLDPDGFRAALAAVLARDVKEVRLVRETFDELYAFKCAGNFPTWEAALARLCAEAKSAP